MHYELKIGGIGMQHTICGVNCSQCGLKGSCGGCIETKGHPFQSECMVAECCLGKGHKNCSQCGDTPCKLKKQIMAEFNALGIADMPEVTALHQLKGAFINLEYTLPSGQAVRMWDDEKIYLGNQLCKINSNRCYGITADENYLLVCEYGEGGTEAEIIVYKKREK